MKKKLVALLLCLVMALSLIPTTVWAADMSWTWTVTVIGGKYCKSDGTESNTNPYTITKYLDNSVPHEIGYKFEWDASAGGSKYNGGWKLCLTVDGQVVKRSSVYIYTKDMSTAAATWTAPANSHTGNSSHPFTIYLSDYSDMAPSKPTPGVVQALEGLVNVYCTTENTNKATSKLISGTYSIGNVTGSANSGYTCPVTITNVAPYVALATGHEEAGNHDTSITLSWNGSNWIATDTATINVKCTPAPNAPEKPTEEEVQALYDPVRIDCATDDTHDTVSALKPQSYTIGDVAGDANSGYTCTITITQPNMYIPVNHELDTDKQNDLTITLVWNNGTWGYAADAADTATIYVKCIPAPEAPAAPTAEDLKSVRGVLVDCQSDPQAISHSDMTFPFFENTYAVGDVVLDQETGRYTCVVTVTDPQAYVNSYDFMLGLMLGKTDLIHHVMQPTTQTPTVTLVYDETNGWQRPERTYATITAICMIKAPTAEDLENYKLVKVDCDTRISHGEKSYALLDGTFSAEVTDDGDGNFQCVITITKDGAKEYVKQYGKDLGKTHSLKKLEDATITLTYKDNGWVVDNNNIDIASILAKCSTGNNSNTNPSNTSDGKPVTSSKTFDAGIALYAGLSILSLTGGALVIRKRKEF